MLFSSVRIDRCARHLHINAAAD